MLVIAFVAPLIAVLLCLALNRFLPTRWLGIVGSLSCLVAGAALLVARNRGSVEIPRYAWANFNDQTIWLVLRFDYLNWVFALVLIIGGAFALLALALSLPANLRGFGSLFAALLLVLLATLVGLALQGSVLLPFVWALIALLSFVALRASGAQLDPLALPIGLSAGMLGALALLGATLTLRMAGVGAIPGLAILLCWLVAGLLALGAPPFHAVMHESSTAPADIAGVLVALGLPILAGAALLRFVATAPIALSAWHTILLLVGLLTLLACAVGAIREHHLRRLIGWQFSAQMGLLLIAFSQNEVALALAAPSLLTNIIVTTLASYLSIAILERHTGTDDLAEIKEAGGLILPGLTFLIAAASTIGLPGTWGFWARWWLYNELLRTTAWVVPPILAGSTLMAIAFFAPLTVFWRNLGPESLIQPRSWASTVTRFCPLVLTLPLLILGVVPQLGARIWSSAAQEMPALSSVIIPTQFSMTAQVVSGIAVFVLFITPFALKQLKLRRALPDPDLRDSGVLAPQGLGESLSVLAWLASPEGLFQRIWQGLIWISQITRRSLALFEQRYYLAGFVIGLVVVILLLL